MKYSSCDYSSHPLRKRCIDMEERSPVVRQQSHISFLPSRAITLGILYDDTHRSGQQRRRCLDMIGVALGWAWRIYWPYPLVDTRCWGVYRQLSCNMVSRLSKNK